MQCKSNSLSSHCVAQWCIVQELAQLRRQNRKNAAHIQSLEAMQAKQNAVLQRKIADATAARKKLRELQVSEKALNAAALVEHQPAFELQEMRGHTVLQPWYLPPCSPCKLREGDMLQ